MEERTFLTTVTPYYERPQSLKALLSWLKRTHEHEQLPVRYFIVCPYSMEQEKEHILLHFAEELQAQDKRFVFLFPRVGERYLFSIGEWHNYGIARADSKWVMKLDCDVVGSSSFFVSLCNMLKHNGDEARRKWFNVGFFNLLRSVTATYDAHAGNEAAQENILNMVNGQPEGCTLAPHYPVASQFVCTKEAYMSFGGCSRKFRGYGWEDYQQLYDLARWSNGGKRVFPFEKIAYNTVAVLCRDKISRTMSRELWEQDRRLCLFHRWHDTHNNPKDYKSHLPDNLQVLLDHVLKCERESV